MVVVKVVVEVQEDPEVEEESSEDEEEEETALTFGSAAPAEAGDGTAPEDLLSMLI